MSPTASPTGNHKVSQYKIANLQFPNQICLKARSCLLSASGNRDKKHNERLKSVPTICGPYRSDITSSRPPNQTCYGSIPIQVSLIGIHVKRALLLCKIPNPVFLSKWNWLGPAQNLNWYHLKMGGFPSSFVNRCPFQWVANLKHHTITKFHVPLKKVLTYIQYSTSLRVKTTAF